MSEDQPTTVDDVVADTEEAVPAAASTKAASLLQLGLDKAAAGEVERTAAESPQAVQKVQPTVDPDTLEQRVALFSLRVDNTYSIAPVYPTVLMGADTLWMAQRRALGNEPVSVLVTAQFLNGLRPLITPYVPLADVPMFGDLNYPDSYDEAVRRFPLQPGLTAWFDRFAEDIAAIIEAVQGMEMHNKTVYAMPAMLVDGLDNASVHHNPASMHNMLAGVRRMRTVIPVAIYAGRMPENAEADYDAECSKMRRYLRGMGINDPEFTGEDATLEQMVRGYFVSLGFAPNMVFLPGNDLEKIIQAILTVSKLMVSHSRGQLSEDALPA